MAKLFADENFPLPVATVLRAWGHDVLTMRETGKAGQSLPDEVVLQLAAAEGRAVLTLNRRHFVRLHSVQADHAGIIVCTFDPDFTALARRIHAAICLTAQLSELGLWTNLTDRKKIVQSHKMRMSSTKS